MSDPPFALSYLCNYYQPTSRLAPRRRAMPVTFQVASHPANGFELYKGCQTSVASILQESCEPQWNRCKEILQSSLQHHELPTMAAYSNGFVHAVLDAYGAHRHLRIRYALGLC